MTKVDDSERFARNGALLGDEEKPDGILRYAYHLARQNNNLPRAYHVGMILRDRLISELEQCNSKNSFWNKLMGKRLSKKLSRLEDELYIINHLHPEHIVPLEKYEFMHVREEEGDRILAEALELIKHAPGLQSKGS